MKKFVKKICKRLDMYEYVKYSMPFRFYEYMFKQHVTAQHNKEVKLYKSFLQPCDLIFDIGAFDGHKTAAFLKISKRVISCEPDPTNFNLLNVRFRNKRKRVRLLQIALSNKIEKKLYFVHKKGSAVNTLNPDWKEILEKDKRSRWDEEIAFSGETLQVNCSRLDSLIGEYGVPDFIKIDVEGYEKEVLQGLSKKVPCISFECLLPEFHSQLLYILEQLISFDSSTRFNVIHKEELLFPEFLSYANICEWLKNPEFDSFDMVARVYPSENS